MALLLCLAAPQSPAQTYTILHTFGTNVMGLNPYSTLVQGPDGALYGTANEGGVANLGQVFKVNPDGSGYAILKDFTGSDGAYPPEGLVLSGTTLYGTTGGGGTNDDGTVFKLNTDGTGFAVLKYFTGEDGAYPYARLLLSGSLLYGTTANGGTNGTGTVFKINTDGTGFTVLKDFTGQNDGAYPWCALVLSDTSLYGTASSGGANNSGVIFKINTDGSDYAVLKDFNGDSDGGWPDAGLVLSGTTLYGTAPGGGAAGNGTVFKLHPDGSGFAVLKDFTNSSEGIAPNASLILSGGTLYGTTVSGGSSGSGTVFKLDTDGSGFAVLKDFTNWTDGANCWSSLMLSNTTLFGTASAGGNYGYGAVFKLEIDGSQFSVTTSFAGGDGAAPKGSLLLSGTNLYGVTSDGGAAGRGTIFRLNTDGSGYTLLKDFTNTADGAYPLGGLVLSGTRLYGTANGGGSNDRGTVFALNTDGSGYTVLHSFIGPPGDASGPAWHLALSGTRLFGTTYNGGSADLGTVFALNTDGSDYAVLLSFTYDNGRWPEDGPVVSGTTLYGTTDSGGSLVNGTVFKLNTDGSGYVELHSFLGDPNGEASPDARPVLSGSTLYGTTRAGGNAMVGKLFKLGTDGSNFLVLKVFTGDDGAYPNAMTLSGGTLFGTAGAGGSSWNGTVFALNVDGTGFTVLKNFNGADGSFPDAAPVVSGATLYGTTANGGSLNSGVLFCLSPGPPTITVPPASQTVAVGATVDFAVQATGWPEPLAYQWFFNGTNALAGATNTTFELTNVHFAQSGAYTVVVTNIYGSATSTTATLNVEDPFINSGPLSQSVGVGATVQFHVDATGTGPLSYQWLKEGTNLNDSGNISGSHTATLTLSNVLGADAGGYSVIVTNVYGSVTSQVATLVVEDPFIITPPVSQTALAWQTIQFSVIPGGTPPFTYQWLKDGTSLNNGGRISGAQTTMLTLSSIFGGDAGQYAVVVSNAFGSVTSAPAVLTVNPAGYSILHWFGGGSDGQYPSADLVLSGSTLYGTTTTGGLTNIYYTLGCGTIFKVNIDGTGFTVLKRFTGNDGALPNGLVLSGTTLYGTTQVGTLFKLDTDGSGFAVLTNIAAVGANPEGRLLLSGAALYGVTQGGGSFGYGTVFKVNTNGQRLALLGSFAGPPNDGTWPVGSLDLSGATLYGTTLYGGITDATWTSGMGTIFKIDTNGSSYAVLKRFGGSDGMLPCAGLALSDGVLYGTTRSGGATNASGPYFWGTVFKMNTNGNGYTVLKTFPDSAQPQSDLVVCGSTLFGTTVTGGSFHAGSVFQINTDGSGYTVLKSFNGSDGNFPYGGLVFSGTTLYGTATGDGGYPNYGLVFSVPVPPVVPGVVMLSQSQTAESGSAVSFAIQVTGFPPPGLQWFLNGTNALAGATNVTLELTNVQLSNVGVYTVVASNLFGSVTSAPVTLNVVPPVARRPVPGIQVTGDSGSLVNVDYAGALNPVPNWSALSLVSLTGTSSFCFDLTAPLPPQRFYRAWQTGTPTVVPVLNLNIVPALTLTGYIGDHLRVDCINQFGPTDAWVTLTTLTLTNTSQLYFDVTAPGQPARLYRIVPVP